MASIYANGSKGHHKFTLTVTETGTSVSNNTSTISFNFKLSPIVSGYDWAQWTNPSRTVSYTVNVNGTNYTGTIPNYDGSSTVTLKSGTQTVAHNTDGTKTISYYFSVNDTTGATYTSGNANANGTLALTTLERPPTGAAPIITASVVDTNSKTIALTGDSKKLIRYHSNARATMSAEAQAGAAIDESLYIIRNGSNTGYGDSYTFNAVEHNAFYFSAEDDRGFVGNATVSAPMVNYIKLTCNISNNRPDASGNMTVFCTGNYFNASFGAQHNSLTVQYSYTGSDGSYGTGNMSVKTSGNTYSATAQVPGLYYQTTYSFTITATDKLSTVTSTESAIKSKPIFHWGEHDFVFEVPVAFNAGTSGGNDVEGDMKVTGNLRLKGTGNYGNALYFGDGQSVAISEAHDGYLYIKAPTIELNGVLMRNGVDFPTVDHGTWTPSLLSAAVSSYSYRNGWYQKIGGIVTIGFYIKATCNSGYGHTNISITGLPHTPTVSASGGGICSGTYISAGYHFQGFVAQTTGNITIRIQKGDDSAESNLVTSASGCSYNVGGGEVTLGGTITYMTNT